MDSRLKMDNFSSLGVCWTGSRHARGVQTDERALEKIVFPLCISHSSVIRFVFIFPLTRPHFHDAWPKHITETEV